MNRAERVLRVVDNYQQSHAFVALPFAVVKKFGDDRGGGLAALIAYYGVLSLFPLLLLIATALGYFLGHSASFEHTVLHSALSQFPIIGDQIQHNIHSLHGSGVGVSIGVLGLLWGSFGVAQAAQHAMNQVWNVPGVVRPGFFVRLAHGLLFLACLGLGVVATSVLSGLGQLANHSAGFRVLALLASTALNVALFLVGFRLLTATSIPTRPLVPGAVVAGLLWQGLQVFGGYLVAHQLRQTSQVYGFFAVVLGLLGWLYLGAQLTIYCAEFNVVWHRGLWPRSLLQPPLTAADRTALAAIAEQEERRPEETVDVTFRQ